ncbi:MAG TPA: hypothetical protein VM912_09710 [Terriglobales bacterium]|nr:hypothetical protein [Terriglobales bacterium]
MGTEHSNQTCDPQDHPLREITAQDQQTIEYPIMSDGISHRDSMGYPNGIGWDIPMELKPVSPYI